MVDVISVLLLYLCLMRWRLLWIALRVTVICILKKKYSSSKELIVLLVYYYGDLLSESDYNKPTYFKVLAVGQTCIGNYVIKRIRIHNWLMNWIVLGLNFLPTWASVLMFEPPWSRRDLSQLDRIRMGGEASWNWLGHSSFNCFLPAVSVFDPHAISSTWTSICT